ncbi:MAG: hypothetical protein Q8876_07830 [Bacillota bacterium]|nr:hypothetical protein [Bacillota bacterium]
MNGLKLKITGSRRRLRTAVLLCLVTLLGGFTATFAWFSLSSFSSIENMQMTIGTGAQLLVATNNYGTDLSKYSNTITGDMIDSSLASYNVKLASFKLDPVTSSDGMKFYSKSGVLRAENQNTYLEFSLYFISTKDMWVHLTSNSSDTKKNDGTSVTTTTASASGVTRCVRISFSDPQNDTKIYEPNKGTPVANQATFDLPSPMKYTNDNRLFDLKSLTPTKITIRLWVEGNDPECVNNIQSAQLGVLLGFAGTDENNEVIG